MDKIRYSIFRVCTRMIPIATGSNIRMAGVHILKAGSEWPNIVWKVSVGMGKCYTEKVVPAIHGWRCVQGRPWMNR